MFSFSSDQENDLAITSQSSHDLAFELANISQNFCNYISIIYLQEIIHVFIEEQLFYVRLCFLQQKRPFFIQNSPSKTLLMVRQGAAILCAFIFPIAKIQHERGRKQVFGQLFFKFFCRRPKSGGRSAALCPLTRLPYAHSYGNSLPIYSAILCQLVPLPPAYPSVCLLRHG